MILIIKNSGLSGSLILRATEPMYLGFQSNEINLLINTVFRQQDFGNG